MLDYVGNDSPAFGHDALRAFCVMVLFTGVKNDQLLSKTSMTKFLCNWCLCLPNAAHENHPYSKLPFFSSFQGRRKLLVTGQNPITEKGFQRTLDNVLNF